VSDERSKPLKPAISPFRGKSNQWWYKLTAASFLIKVALVIGIFLAVKYAADRAAADRAAEDNRPAAADSAETE
jgi:hypothetical protein